MVKMMMITHQICGSPIFRQTQIILTKWVWLKIGSPAMNAGIWGFHMKFSDKTKSLLINPSLSTDATPDDAKI
jgi:hypothetical protein